MGLGEGEGPKDAGDDGVLVGSEGAALVVGLNGTALLVGVVDSGPLDGWGNAELLGVLGSVGLGMSAWKTLLPLDGKTRVVGTGDTEAAPGLEGAEAVGAAVVGVASVGDVAGVVVGGVATGGVTGGDAALGLGNGDD